MARFLSAGIAVIALAVGAAFAALNFQSATVDVFFTAVQTPLAIALGLAFAAGALLGLLASGIRILRLREQLRRAQQPATRSEMREAGRPPAPKLR